ncbi:MAG: RNA-protein complex protein Nop10 [Candidatus Hodarchaeota archaeon]
MPKRLRKCVSCGHYTLAASCSRCGNQARLAHPPRFSVQDKYAKYRRVFRSK